MCSRHAGRKLNPQIKTGGSLEERQSPEQQHPELEEQTPTNLSSLSSASSRSLGLATSPAFSETIQPLLSGKVDLNLR